MLISLFQSALILLLLSFVSASKYELTEKDWVPYRGYLYLFLKESHYFAEAEARCVELGGHLASIHSLEENKFIHKLRDRQTVWLGKRKTGINSFNVTGVYEWSDGSPHDDFTPPWDLCQPNEPWTDCIFMAYRANNLGRWSDFFCYGKPFPFYYIPGPPYSICKKRQIKNDL